MSDARCPLVREIDEIEHRGIVIGRCQARKERGDYTQHDARLEASMYDTNITNKLRLRAALEAAEEMAEHADKVADAPGLWMVAKRYRAATRTEE